MVGILNWKLVVENLRNGFVLAFWGRLNFKKAFMVSMSQTINKAQRFSKKGQRNAEA